MTPLSRYDPNASTETGMIAHSSGDWVPFDEALARIAELEAERKRLLDWMGEAVTRVLGYSVVDVPQSRTEARDRP